MDMVVAGLLICGLVFFTGGAVGILRFPDFYSRLHPAGKLDTAGQLFMMASVAVFVVQDVSLANLLTAAKIMLIVVFIYLTSPTATHAIVHAGVRAGLVPWTRERSGT
jgi:multicomponent Na+:H+ antiporter subunit G